MEGGPLSRRSDEFSKLNNYTEEARHRLKVDS